jgi:lysozyme
MQETRQNMARETQERTNMASDVAMLKERVRGIESAQEQLSRDIMELKEMLSKRAAADGDMSSKLSQAVSSLQARDDQMQKETIESISRKMAEIMKAQGASSSRGVSTTGVEHVVEAGQTLSAIAQAYGVTVSAIVKANNLANANSVREGQKLFIPR